MSRVMVDPDLLAFTEQLLEELGGWRPAGRRPCPFCGQDPVPAHGVTCPLGRAKSLLQALRGDERAAAILRRSRGRCGNGQTDLLGHAGDEVVFGPFLVRHRDYPGDEPPEPKRHAIGLPGWSPPTLCGEPGELAAAPVGEVTCQGCIDLVGNPEALARRFPASSPVPGGGR